MAAISLAAGLVFAMAPPAFATTQQVPMPAPPDPLPAPAVDGLYPMPFPIQTDPANYTYTDTFGHCRSGCNRGHNGVDIMAYGVKGYPVVAVADGTITWTSGSCCALAINHDDDWKSYYIHLNNDTQNPDGSYNDDGTGSYLPGIAEGVHVERGQVIGLVGDSGNAEACNCPHLHFEIIDPAGTWHNPTPYVDRATRLSEPIPTVFEGQFWDDEGLVHEANIDIMYEQGITRGCNPPANDRFCPSDQITRGQMAAFLRRLLDLPAVGTDYFSDDFESIFEGDINALAEEGIGFGCTETEYCPDTPLRREEMAELLVRTFGYANPGGTDFFVDDESSVFQESINKLANHDITKGCNPPANDEFCPDENLSRAQMATFLARALELGT